jgi:ankyrin repeat protein
MKTYPFFRPLFSARLARLAFVLFAAFICASLAFAGPIHDAARKGDVKKLKELLASDPKLVSSLDGKGNTPLHMAAFHGEVGAAQVLLDAGADINAKNHYAPYVPDEYGMVFTGSNHKDPVFLLDAKGLNAQDNQNGYAPLALAMFSVHHKEMVALLVAKGADVNTMASSGATPLLFAVLRNQKDDAMLLLDKGANVNAADAYKNSILGAAVGLQYESLVKLLVDNGADVNFANQQGQRALSFALQGSDDGIVNYLKKHGAHE